MKSKLFILTAFVVALVLSGCSKDDSSNPVIPISTDNLVKTGTWRITRYWDSDHDETYHFTGYSFTFGSDGTLSASSGQSAVSGSWSTLTDDSRLKMVLSFSNPPDFAELSDDWTILESTTSKIRLEDVSGGGSGTDYLTFEKN